jgi:hypothetical protein
LESFLSRHLGAISLAVGDRRVLDDIDTNKVSPSWEITHTALPASNAEQDLEGVPPSLMSIQGGNPL